MTASTTELRNRQVPIPYAQAAEGILQALMNHVPEGITIAYGPDAVIHSVSKHGLELIARSEEEVTRIGAEAHPAAWQVFHLDGVVPMAPHELPLTRACRGEVVQAEEVLIMSSTGRMFPILCNAGPIRNEQGEVVGGIIAWRDNTAMHALIEDKSRLAGEAEAARAAAETANKAKDVFLAKLSHELRTPLSAVVGWADIARRRAEYPDEVRHAMDVIERNAALERRLVDDLLDLNRIVSGRLDLSPGDVRLQDVVQDALESVELLARERAVSLVSTLQPVAVRGDAARLQQVVINLVNNAIKFSPEGAAVVVELVESSGRAVLTVTDCGPGLSAEDAGKVFEPFWQGRQAGASTGLGLGLAIVRTLTEMHGGSVRVTSDGPGRGCRFEVTLPAIAA